MRRHLAFAGAAGLAVLTLAPMSAHAAESDATVSVLHAVPGLTVDVYANGEELIPDFAPGTLTDTLQLPAGTYDLQVFADGDTRPRGTGHRGDRGGGAGRCQRHRGGPPRRRRQPGADPVRQRHVATEAGQARLMVRHTAAAPPVDVRADGEVLFAEPGQPRRGVR